MSSKIIYKKGEIIGQVSYIKDTPYVGERRAIFKCKCGNIFNAQIMNVKRLNTKSSDDVGIISKLVDVKIEDNPIIEEIIS